MELHLLTYDCIVCCNGGYPPGSWSGVYPPIHKAIESGEHLIKYAKKFAHEANIRPEDVILEKGEGISDGMIIFYAHVSQDWEPTEKTIVYDESVNTEKPYHVTTLWTWIHSKGSKFMRDADNPTSAHNLYRTKK